MDNLISIIVPVFNIEKYIGRCVYSLINQTYRNIEIVLVDDGSTDNSARLCDELKCLDTRIIVFHKSNGGLSDARNYGIRHSKGNFITFVDGDDRLTENACEILLLAALRNDSKIVVGGLMLENDNGDISYERSLCDIECNKLCNDALNLVFSGRGYSACGKLFRKELFSDIKFPKGKLDEDFAIMYKLFIKAGIVTYVTEYVYYYFKRGGSITKSGFSNSKIDFVNNAEDAIVYIKRNMSDNEILKRAEAFLCNRIDMVIHLIIFDKNKGMFDNELRELVYKLRVNYKILFRSKYIDNKDRLVMFSELISPEIYRLFKSI